MRLLVINGPNLNLLGSREPSIYGSLDLAQLIDSLTSYCIELGIELDDFQSNTEGFIIDKLHAAIDNYKGIIINAGAYTHYSYAIRDAIKAINIPVLELHISNVYNREDFRHTSVIAPVCIGQIAGLGVEGYFLAVDYFYRTLVNGTNP